MMGQRTMNKYWLPWYAFSSKQNVSRIRADHLLMITRLVGMPAETSLAICSLIFGGVLERLPKLKIAFAHAGGSFPGTIGRIEHGWNCRPDLCAVDCKRNPREYLGSSTLTMCHQPTVNSVRYFNSYCTGRFWVDSLTHDEANLKYVVELFGKDKVALGTDYPFPRTALPILSSHLTLTLAYRLSVGEQEPGKLIESVEEFDDDTKRKLLGENALEFLGLSKSQFIGECNDS